MKMLLVMIVGSLSQLAGQTADVVGTLLHAGRDIVYLVGLQTVTTGGKHLCKATDNVEWRTYLVNMKWMKSALRRLVSSFS